MNYQEKIKELEQSLHNKNKRVYRNKKFEQVDVNSMFRGNINHLFDLEINEKQYILKLNMLYNKTRTYKFDNQEEFSLWILRRLDLATNFSQHSSTEDKVYYLEIMNQLTQLENFIKNNPLN